MEPRCSDDETRVCDDDATDDATTMMRRRTVLSAVLVGAVSLASCTKKPRCKRCGMVLDPASRWRAELRGPGDAVLHFDTPKCALVTLRQGSPDGREVWVVGYYGQAMLPASKVVFALGSDVLGPMGADFVPVEPEHASKFDNDHAAKRMLRLPEVTLALAEGT